MISVCKWGVVRAARVNASGQDEVVAAFPTKQQAESYRRGFSQHLNRAQRSWFTIRRLRLPSEDEVMFRMGFDYGYEEALSCADPDDCKHPEHDHGGRAAWQSYLKDKEG